MVAVYFINQEASCMKENNSIIIDTNILVYAYTDFDKNKHKMCEMLIESAFRGEKICAVSNQILSELFFVLTEKLKEPVPIGDASDIISGIIDSINWIKLNYTYETVKKSILLSKTHNIQIWDSLIAETALENGITKIYTDKKDFSKIPGFKAINPTA